MKQNSQTDIIIDALFSAAEHHKSEESRCETLKKSYKHLLRTYYVQGAFKYVSSSKK